MGVLKLSSSLNAPSILKLSPPLKSILVGQVQVYHSVLVSHACPDCGQPDTGIADVRPKPRRVGAHLPYLTHFRFDQAAT